MKEYLFVLLLTVWGGETPKVFVVDYGLTAEDCIAAMVDYYENDNFMSHGVISCEFDFGEPWDELPQSGYFGEE
jgi:hypothetical protein